jgi:NAD(P)H-dependent FMN reductase
MVQVKVLAFAGSLRKGSFNKRLLKNAVRGAEKAGAEVTVVDLKDYPLPLYDGDLEKTDGIPENAKKLKEIMKSCHAFMIASPEYNSGISGALKNVIDWTSRPEPDEPAFVCFDSKPVLMLSASTGALGGLRGLFHLRWVLSNIRMIVLPQQVTLREARSAFDENGDLKDSEKKSQVESAAKLLVTMAGQLQGA